MKGSLRKEAFYTGGRRLYLAGEWHSALRSKFENSGIPSLLLSSTRGWKGSDISFLQSLPSLRELRISGEWLKPVPPLDLSPLSELPWIEQLSIQVPYYAGSLDLKGLPHLGELHFDVYDIPLSGFEGASSLRRLRLAGSKRIVHLDLSSNSALADLQIIHGKGLERITLSSAAPIQSIRLAHCRTLETVANLGAQKALETLEIESCARLAWREALPASLHHLVVRNGREIPDLRFLHQLPELKEFFMSGTTSIADGDLSLLTTQPRLRRVTFKDQKHYLQKWKQVQAVLDQRHASGQP